MAQSGEVLLDSVRINSIRARLRNGVMSDFILVPRRGIESSLWKPAVSNRALTSEDLRILDGHAVLDGWNGA